MGVGDLYKGYREIAEKLTSTQDILELIENLAPCIHYVLTQKLAWTIFRRVPRGELGDWFTAIAWINEEFQVLEIERPYESELFTLLVFKCLLITAYQCLQARHQELPSIFTAATSKRYIDDVRAVEIIQTFSQEELSILLNDIRRVSSRDMNFPFLLDGEVEMIFKKYSNSV